MENEPRPPKESGDSTPTPTGERPLWRSPSVIVAAVFMLAGLGFWVYGAATGKGGDDVVSGSASASSFMDSNSDGVEQGESEGSLEPISPVTFRLGAGYLGGFFLGWALRKFIKLTLLIAGGLVVMLAVFQGLGWFEVNWPAVENHLQMSLAWIQGEAGSFRMFITGYLPSAGAATAGMVVGFRR